MLLMCCFMYWCLIVVNGYSRMTLLLFLILAAGSQTGTSAQKCSSPIVSSRMAFIYRSYPTIKVKVTSCFFNDDNNDQNNYYDVTPNCREAVKTGTFMDKYSQVHYIESNSTKIIIDEYTVDADPLKNTLFLRSGKKCKYDTGFCYDSEESPSYAATWNVPKLQQERCSDDLVQIFYGYVDFWTFEPENRKYLFYTVPFTDKSFALSLSNSSFCHNNQVWYADENGYIVSFNAVTSTVIATPVLDQKLLPPLKPKEIISDKIIEDCSLKGHGLNFDTNVDTDYLGNSENLEIILKIFQQDIDNNKKTLETITNNFKNFPGGYVKTKNENDNLDILKNSVDHNLKNINELFDKFEQLVFVDQNIFLKMSNIFTDINKIKKDITNLFENNSIVRQDSKSLQLQLEQIFSEINKSIKSIVKVEVDNLRPNSEPSVLSNVIPLLRFANQSSPKIQNVNRDFKTTLTELSNDNSSEQNFKDNENLNTVKSFINKKCDHCQDMNTTFREIIEQVEQCIIDQKNVKEDFIIMNDSFLLKFSESERVINNLSSSLDQCMKRSSVDQQIQDILNKVTLPFQLFNSSIESEIISKINPLLTNINLKISENSNNFNNLKTEVENSSSKIDTCDSKLKDLTNKLSEFQDNLEKDRTLNKVNMNIAKTNISAIYSFIDEAAYNTKVDILTQVLRKFNSSAMEENIAKELETVKKLLNDSLSSFEEEIKKIKEHVFDYEQSTKLNPHDSKTQEITQDLRKVEENLNNLPQTIEDTIMKKVMPTFFLAFDKNYKCERELNQLKFEFQEFKDTYNKTIERLLNGV